MSGWRVAATVCGFLSLLLLLIALGSDHWLDAHNGYAGLWRACLDVPALGFVCGYTRAENNGGHIHATRAFLILGALAGFIACGLLVLLFFRSEIGSYSAAKSASISSYVAGIFALIALAIFTGGGGTSSPYGWSFGLGWACGPLFLVTGTLALKLPM